MSVFITPQAHPFRNRVKSHNLQKNVIYKKLACELSIEYNYSYFELFKYPLALITLAFRFFFFFLSPLNCSTAASDAAA